MRTVTTRSQRRMERKQAMLLLLMVLAVALVSFALGVMVGRSGSAVAKTEELEGSGKQTVEKHPAPEPVAPAQDAARSADADLTFYETLPKGEKSPMGSGINLPPGEQVEPDAVSPAPADGGIAAKIESQSPEKAQTPETVTKRTPEPESGEGTFLLQVASFRDLKGALSLQEKLHRKGYLAQVREVDLGEKGVWSRVVVGPFDSRSEARATLERLKREERLSPMIRKG